MSAGTISLESAIRTCKVQTSNADKIESDRFLSPQNMVCPAWNGLDIQGREVCVDSNYTKRAGCNSAQDRVTVENNHRPQYMEYITLSANGIDGSIYQNMKYNNQNIRNKDMQEVKNVTGNFGQNHGRNVQSSCGVNSYNNAMAQSQQNSRRNQYMNQSYYNNKRQQYSGNRK